MNNCAADLEEARASMVLTLCELEKIFPPSFFDIMEHLPIHLADEALIAGAVIFQWIYPIERYLFTLKEYVRNRACPEASIAKGYLMEECMNFCTQYLNDVESKFNRPLRKKIVMIRTREKILYSRKLHGHKLIDGSYSIQRQSHRFSSMSCCLLVLCFYKMHI